MEPGICGRSTRISNETFHDERGFLSKLFHRESHQLLNPYQTETFLTKSRLGTFRGMHLQYGDHSAEKVIVVVAGRISYYQIDIELLDQHQTAYTSVIDSKEFISIHVPSGIAHGYVALEEDTSVLYFQNVSFCAICDTGFKSDSIINHAQSLLGGRELILSSRDAKMDSFLNHKSH